MSVYFEIGGQVVWNPGLRRGQIFVGYVRTLEQVFGLDAGIDAPMPDDTFQIDVTRLQKFVLTLLEESRKTNSLQYLSALRVVLGPSLHLLGLDAFLSAHPEVSEAALQAAETVGLG